MQRLRAFLLAPQMPLWRYCLLAFPLALIPSAIFLALAQTLFAVSGVDTSAIGVTEKRLVLSEVLGATVFAPLIETLLLAVLLSMLSALTSRTALVVCASALAWGCLHAAFGFIWLFGTTWSFFIFSCGYLAWRKLSFRQAFLAAAVPHALINSTALLALALLDRA